MDVYSWSECARDEGEPVPAELESATVLDAFELPGHRFAFTLISVPGLAPARRALPAVREKLRELLLADEPPIPVGGCLNAFIAEQADGAWGFYAYAIYDREAGSVRVVNVSGEDQYVIQRKEQTFRRVPSHARPIGIIEGDPDSLGVGFVEAVFAVHPGDAIVLHTEIADRCGSPREPSGDLAFRRVLQAAVGDDARSIVHAVRAEVEQCARAEVRSNAGILVAIPVRAREDQLSG